MRAAHRRRRDDGERRSEARRAARPTARRDAASRDEPAGALDPRGDRGTLGDAAAGAAEAAAEAAAGAAAEAAADVRPPIGVRRDDDRANAMYVCDVVRAMFVAPSLAAGLNLLKLRWLARAIATDVYHCAACSSDGPRTPDARHRAEQRLPC